MPTRALPKGSLRSAAEWAAVLQGAPDVQWELAVPAGLRPSPGSKFWHAGHVNALLPWGETDLLLGTHSGGVWHLSRRSAGRKSSVDATPLSDDWDNPDVLSLGAGGDGPDHAFAGCYRRARSGASLYEALPGTNGRVWQPVDVAPSFTLDQFGDVYGVCVVRRRLVCATSGGLFWAPIPPVGSTGPTRSGYQWQRAVWDGGAAPGGVSGLVLAAGGSPVVSALAGGTIWYGRFARPAGGTGEQLTMRRARSPAVGKAGRSTLAASGRNPKRLFAVIGHTPERATTDPDEVVGSIAAVLTSPNAGRSWQPVNGQVTRELGAPLPAPGALVEDPGTTGRQSGWNVAIAVSPGDENTVVIGWQLALFISSNATARTGVTWNRIHDAPSLPVHKDVHVLWFDPRPKARNRLYVGSDGGLISSDDRGGSFESNYNASLANLQFESTPEWETYGTISASPTVAGVVAGGLQDNGVVWGRVGSHDGWTEEFGGDGAGTAFLADGSLVGVAIGSVDIQRTSVWTWSTDHFEFQSRPPRIGPDGALVDEGLINPVLAGLRTPAITDSEGRKLSAVGGYGREPNVVYGLYRHDDGSDAIWKPAGSLPSGHEIWAFAPGSDGTVLWVGGQVQTVQGDTSVGSRANLYRLDLDPKTAGKQPAWTMRTLSPPPPLVDGVDDFAAHPYLTRLVLHPDGRVLAAYNTRTSGQLLAYKPADDTWTRLSGRNGLRLGSTFGVEVDPLGTIYVAFDDCVFASRGGLWWNVSAGLPRRAHLGHLCYAPTANGGSDLYLSTFGRSLWRARFGTPVPDSVKQRAWGWNQLIGSLADGRLYKLGTKGGIRPIPGPGDPSPAARKAAAQRFQDMLAMARETEQAANLVASELDVRGSDAAGAAELRALANTLAQSINALLYASNAALAPRTADAAQLMRASSALVAATTSALVRASKTSATEGAARSNLGASSASLFQHIKALETFAARYAGK